MTEDVRYCEYCKQPFTRRVYDTGAEGDWSFENRRFCSRNCANMGRKKRPRRGTDGAAVCRPGRKCLQCPYPDCRAKSVPVTEKENEMIRCAGSDTFQRDDMRRYYTPEVRINIEIIINELEEEESYE